MHNAHGEPISTITANWISLIRTFQAKYGNNIHPSRLPAQTYFDGSEERLTDGTMIAELLSHVISPAEEKEQKERLPEEARQVGITWTARSRSRLAVALCPHRLQTWKSSTRSTRS